MIDAEFFQKKGLLRFRRHFYSDLECQNLIREMHASPARPAQVFESEDASAQGYRNTRNVLVSDAIRAEMTQRLLAEIPALSEFYRLDLKSIQTLQFYCYQPGDYLKSHFDWIDEMQGTVPRRLLSLVLYLNQAGPPEQGGYQGGELMFYPESKRGGPKLGLPLKTETGMLITFDPEVLHEVRPVTTGYRYSVVAWYC